MSKNVLILSQSVICKDARVLKHVRFFKQHNYIVYIAGWDRIPVYQSKNIMKRFGDFFTRYFFPLKYFNEHYATLLQDIPEKTYSIVLANDWNTLPIADKIAKKTKALLIYDSHEFATREWDNSLWWRITMKNFVHYIERTFIKKASLVCTVCSPIAREIEKKYKRENVVVLHNIPSTYGIMNFYYNLELPIKIYHHGGYNNYRQLELLCEAVKFFQGKIELNLRIFGDTDGIYNCYKNQSNIHFLEPVEPDKVVQACMGFHIGFHMLPPNSYNNIVALPNKFFDYILAEIPILTSKKNISMCEIVEKYDIGFVVSNFTVHDLCLFFNNITKEEIIRKQENFKQIRGQFNAENEWEHLFNAINEIQD